MNIYFSYDKNNEEFENKVIDLKDYIKNNSDIYEMKILLKISQKTKCDMHIMLSNDIDEISKKFEKIKDSNKVIIITSNVETSHILKCIDFTSNLTYLGNKSEVILDRINKIYEENNKK